MQADNSLSMKKSNCALILRLLRANPLSRAELSRRVGLTRAAVSVIADRLISLGIVTEGEPVKGENGGRTAVALNINPNAGFAGGVDISREGVTVAVTDLLGNTVFKRFTPFLPTPEQTMLWVKNELGGKKIMGAGVTVPGPVDTENGVILSPPKLEFFRNYPIKQRLTELLDMPVTVEKDTNALALAEKNVSGLDNFIFVLADHGLGCGIVNNGSLFKGYMGFGGEIGHITLDINGPRCACGSRGCAELYTSVPQTVEYAGATDYGQMLQNAHIYGDAIRRQGEMLAATLKSAVNMFAPEYIVLGGKLKQGYPLLKDIIETKINSNGLNGQKVTVAASCLKEDCRVDAAAGLVTERFFLNGL